MRTEAIGNRKAFSQEGRVPGRTDGGTAAPVSLGPSDFNHRKYTPTKGASGVVFDVTPCRWHYS